MVDMPGSENKEEKKLDVTQTNEQSGKGEQKIKEPFLQEFQHFVQENTRDAFAYLVLFIGILLSAFGSFYGAMMIGLVAGNYYAQWIFRRLQKMSHLVEKEGIFKSFVGMGTLVGFLIASPGIFCGIAASIAIRYLMSPDSLKSEACCQSGECKDPEKKETPPS